MKQGYQTPWLKLRLAPGEKDPPMPQLEVTGAARFEMGLMVEEAVHDIEAAEKEAVPCKVEFTRRQLANV